MYNQQRPIYTGDTYRQFIFTHNRRIADFHWWNNNNNPSARLLYGSSDLYYIELDNLAIDFLFFFLSHRIPSINIIIISNVYKSCVTLEARKTTRLSVKRHDTIDALISSHICVLSKCLVVTLLFWWNWCVKTIGRDILQWDACWFNDGRSDNNIQHYDDY